MLIQGEGYGAIGLCGQNDIRTAAGTVLDGHPCDEVDDEKVKSSDGESTWPAKVQHDDLPFAQIVLKESRVEISQACLAQLQEYPC
jgi:hypothetical protein